ncbi:MAG: flagellar biosynthesis protein FlhB [Ruminococcus sp.]|jgi:flagellar biosynthetic protein FlhB|nr:flagellar biosynthesis protein FlhB [Ruminococcus sp.]
MAKKDGPGGERTEKATSHKRQEERKKGHVAKSQDVVTALFILIVFFVLRLTVPSILQTGQDIIRYWITISGYGFDGDKMLIDGMPVYTKLIFEFVKNIALTAGLLLITTLAVTILATGFQTKWLFTWQSMKPNFKKFINPSSLLNFLKPNSQKIVEFAKSLAKMTILVMIAFTDLRGRIPYFARLYDMEVISALQYMAECIWSIVVKVTIAFMIIAVADVLYQRWKFEEDMKMSKKEVEEEHKNQEGDPKIKGKRRAIQQKLAMNRMMKAIPTADVIIRNPTHYAVALKYTGNEDRAPVVVARGMDNVALRIIKIAEESGVSLIENRPLARALYTECQLEQEIPAKFYQAVAEVLAFIMKLKKGQPATYRPQNTDYRVQNTDVRGQNSEQPIGVT